MSVTHIIGAGMSGLGAAVKLAGDGRKVILYEAAAQAGGRCRSYMDAKLGIHIDNGNHFLLSGNRCAAAYMDQIGARDRFMMPDGAIFPFHDVRSGEEWTLDISKGRFPFWIFSKARRIPDTSPWDYLGALRLLRAGPDTTMADCFPAGGPLYEKFWQPLTLAVLNAPMEKAAATLMRPVLKEIFAKGAAASRLMIAKHGLSDSLVTPALAYLAEKGGEIRFNQRLTGFIRDDTAVTALRFGDDEISLAPGETVILATPPWITADIMPEIMTPSESYPIVNAHFLLDQPPPKRQDAPLLALIGSPAHWLAFRDRLVSVTVSAASDLVGQPAEAIAGVLWKDVAKAVGLEGTDMPPVRIVKEKRATFAQTPEAVKNRPGPVTAMKNVFLAGDWTDTGVPATIEGSIRSGFRAADLVEKAYGSESQRYRQ